jgi:hypothetical protein
MRRLFELLPLLSLLIAFGANASGKNHPAHQAAAKKSPGGQVDKKPPAVKVNGTPAASDSSPQETATNSGAPPPTRGPTRIDFDDRLIQGQTNKSGAVYLYDRKELKTKSMIKTRDSFRDEIVGSLYDS